MKTPVRPSAMPPRSTSPAMSSGEDASLGPMWYWLLVLLPVLFNAVMLFPELTAGVPSRNDSTLHSLMIHSASEALQQGLNVTDFWIPQLDLGFPQFLYYQHLPHLFVVGLHRVLLGMVSLDALLRGTTYLLLVCFPFTVAWSVRRMGFSVVATAFSALTASLLAGSARQCGLEYDSYVWGGLGLYTQLWAVHLSLVTLAVVIETVNEGTGYVRTAMVLAALALSHVLYCAMMVASCALIVTVGASRRSVLPRAIRLAIPGLIALAVTSYFWWPFLQSGFLYVSSRPDLIGAGRPRRDDFSALVHGLVFDYQRLPVLSVLAMIGACVAAVRRTSAHRIALYGALLWLVLYLDPPLGPLRLLFHEQTSRVFYRAIGPLHIFGVLLIGVVGDALWALVARVCTPQWRGPAIIATALLLTAPAFVERAHHYTQNAELISSTRVAIENDADQANLLTAIAANAGGRVTAGPPTGWGSTMRVGANSLSDMANSRRLPAVGAAVQALSLNMELLRELPIDNVNLFDFYDIRTVILPANVTAVPAFYQPRFRLGRYAAWRVPTSGAAGFVAVSHDTIVRSQRVLWDVGKRWLGSDGPRTRTVQRVEYGRSVTATSLPSARQGCLEGQITDERVTSQSVAIEAQCPHPSALMFKFTYHPNWRVRIDGAAVSTYMVTPAFLAADIPAGPHTVIAEYVPTPSKKPLLVFGVLVLLAAAIGRAHLDDAAQWLSRTRTHPIG